MTERTGVADRVSDDVIIEINEGLFELQLTASNGFSPMTKPGVRIVPAVPGAATVKAEIGEICVSSFDQGISCQS